MTVEFMDAPPAIARQGGPRDLPPEVKEFLSALEQNPDKWAEFPGDRKTKPVLSEEFQVVGRDGKWYVSYMSAETFQKIEADRKERAAARAQREEPEVL